MNKCVKMLFVAALTILPAAADEIYESRTVESRPGVTETKRTEVGPLGERKIETKTETSSPGMGVIREKKVKEKRDFLGNKKEVKIEEKNY